MAEMKKTSLPKWFWFAGGGALLWNLVGIAGYIADVTMSQEAVAALSEEQRALREATPLFITGAWAIAVFAGAAGSAALLVRKALATPLLSLSLGAVLVQFGYVFLGTKALAVYGATAAILPALITIIALLLVRFSMSAQRKNWID